MPSGPTLTGQEAMAVAQVPSAQAMMARDAASRGLGIELVDHAEGRAVTRMTVRADMVNGHAVAHGGLIFTLADTAFACACNSYGPVTVAAAAPLVPYAPPNAATMSAGVTATSTIPLRGRGRGLPPSGGLHRRFLLTSLSPIAVSLGVRM